MSQNDKVNELLKMAEGLQNDNSFEIAREMYDLAIKISPSYSESYEKRGEMFFGMEEYDEAIRNLLTALHLISINLIYESDKIDSQKFETIFNKKVRITEDIELRQEQTRDILMLEPKLKSLINIYPNLIRCLGQSYIKQFCVEKELILNKLTFTNVAPEVESDMNKSELLIGFVFAISNINLHLKAEEISHYYIDSQFRINDRIYVSSKDSLQRKVDWITVKETLLSKSQYDYENWESIDSLRFWVDILEQFPSFIRYYEYTEVLYDVNIPNYELYRFIKFFSNNPSVLNDLSPKNAKGLFNFDIYPFLGNNTGLKINTSKFITFTGYAWSITLSLIPRLHEYCNWSSLCMSDWVLLLSFQPQFSTFCDWKMLTADQSVSLLIIQPHIFHEIEWEKLSGKNWFELLSVQPQFSTHCSWDKIVASHWTLLLSSQPQFSTHCNYSKLAGCHWTELLLKQLHLSNLCNWTNFFEEDWVRLLSSHPQFIINCDLSIINSSGWSKILAVQPLLLKYCDWDKLCRKDWGFLLSNQPLLVEYCLIDLKDDWVVVLTKQPQLAELCTCWEYSSYLWSTLLSEQPQFLEFCKTLDELSNFGWVKILSKQPQLINPLYSKWSKHGGAILSEYPEFAEYYKCWDSQCEYTCESVLMKQPQFVTYYKNFSKMYGPILDKILQKHPHLIEFYDWHGGTNIGQKTVLKVIQYPEYCDWEVIRDRNESYVWVNILMCHPQLSEHCNWDCIDYSNRWYRDNCFSPDWSTLLKSQPQFIEFCSFPDRLLVHEWVGILCSQPQLESYFSRWDELNDTNWGTLLSAQPQFIRLCNLDKIDDWGRILKTQPHLSEYCDWSKLTSEHWPSLLIDQPELSRYCDWKELLDDRPSLQASGSWAYLLIKQPHFSEQLDKFFCWGLIRPCDWAKLLEVRPQFSTHCDFSKISIDDLVYLIQKQPQFAVHCNWNSLTARTWLRLLKKQPQFAVHCDWGKSSHLYERYDPRSYGWKALCSEEWTSLLIAQPQLMGFSKYSEKIIHERMEFLGPYNKDRRFRLKEILIVLENLNISEFSSFSDKTWMIVLDKFPNLSQYCDWSQLDGCKFADNLRDEILYDMEGMYLSILLKHPKLSNVCDWSRFEGKDWSRLLSHQPKFLQFCDWSKLSKNNWDDVLTEQPQFSVFRK